MLPGPGAFSDKVKRSGRQTIRNQHWGALSGAHLRKLCSKQAPWPWRATQSSRNGSLVSGLRWISDLGSASAHGRLETTTVPSRAAAG